MRCPDGDEHPAITYHNDDERDGIEDHDETDVG